MCDDPFEIIKNNYRYTALCFRLLIKQVDLNMFHNNKSELSLTNFLFLSQYLLYYEDFYNRNGN